MSFKEVIADLSTRSQTARSMAQTEEATKNAIIMPFLRALGFDVFDPNQVIPEFISDVGTKKGEKVDYAVRIKGRIEFIIEAKSVNVNLSETQYSQLFRYFSVTDSKIAILTNGIDFWFFTDIDEQNKMDATPFFKFNLDAYDDGDLRELEKFHKERFEVEKIRSTASSLKYTRLATTYISSQWDRPDDDFVKLVARSFYDGNITKSVIESLRPNVKRAFDDLFRQKVRQKLAAAFNEGERETNSNGQEEIEDPENPSEIFTTEEEYNGFHIVRAIGAEIASIDRINIRDKKSYCSVIFDNNNRKPIIRMHFNGNKKFIHVFDTEKNGTRFDIERVEDIFNIKKQILETIKGYTTDNTDPSAPQ